MPKYIIGVSGAQGSFSEEAAEYYCYKNAIAPKENLVEGLRRLEQALKTF